MSPVGLTRTVSGASTSSARSPLHDRPWDRRLGLTLDFSGTMVQSPDPTHSPTPLCTVAPECPQTLDFSGTMASSPSPEKKRPPKGCGWWAHQGASHPASGSGGTKPRDNALADVGRMLMENCNRGWFDSRRIHRCPNNGRCFNGVVVPRLLRAGYRVVTAPVENAIKAFHAIQRDLRGQWVLDQLNAWKDETADGKVTLRFKIAAAGNVEVCKYCFAHFHGISKSMIKGAEKRARKGQQVYNPDACIFGRVGRPKKPSTLHAMAWARGYLKWRGYNPHDGDKFLEKLCLKVLHRYDYTREAGGDAVSYPTFVKAFTTTRKAYKIKWKTDKDHLSCTYCKSRKQIVRDRAMIGTETQKTAVLELSNHKSGLSSGRHPSGTIPGPWDLPLLPCVPCLRCVNRAGHVLRQCTPVSPSRQQSPVVVYRQGC